LTDSQRTVRQAISKICARFPYEYWLECDNKKRWPDEFTTAIAKDGWLGICIPSEYGGSDMGLTEAVTMMQTISESGGGFSATSSVHMNIFGLSPVVKYGTEEQKKRFSPPLIEGKDTACFAVTEPNAGLDTLKLQSTATPIPPTPPPTSSMEVRLGPQPLNAPSKSSSSSAPPPKSGDQASRGLSLFYTPLERAAISIVERYLRECLIPRIALVSREMCLNYIGERVLGLPKSY
ncbi:acyl-CoA dehydrogenase/oxidase, partial [Macrophomina phaseolina]